jgi:hypothetical protein
MEGECEIVYFIRHVLAVWGFIFGCKKTNNMKLLFLDDIRNPKDCLLYMHPKIKDIEIYRKEWQIVRSHIEFVTWIETNGLPDFISFDHDLGLPEDSNTEEQNGMTNAKWLVNYCLDNDLKLPDFVVHSSNPAGAKNIEGLLKGFGEWKIK